MQPLQHSFTAADSIVRVADLFIRRNAKMRQHDCMHYAAADSSVLIRTYPYKSVPASRAQQAFVLLHSTACRLLSAAFS